MSTAAESIGEDTNVLVCDPVVPILDIPPNEDLALSNATAAAVASIGEGEDALEEMEAAAAASAVEIPIVGEEDVTTSAASAEAGGKNVVHEEEKSPVAEAAPGVETSFLTRTTTTMTTTTVIDTESFVLDTDIVMASTATSGDSTVLIKREKPDEGESGPPKKKVKPAEDEQELAAAAAAAATSTRQEKSSGEVDQGVVQLGPKTFASGVDMFKYFYELLHAWVSNVDVNQYEFLVLSDLISRGHRDAEAKTGSGIQSFQIRFHPGWHSRCYYLIRTDGSVDDFSYRKCVDKIMPLPENLFSPTGDLLVEKLFGPEEEKWSKKSKGRENFVDGRRNHGGQINRGGRGGRGGRRGGGWGGHF